MPTPEELLRTYLAERDEPCPGCSYSLRALTGTRCPECNQELVLRVGLAESRLAWFVAGVIGIAMGLGFSSMVFGWACVVMLRRRGLGGPQLAEITPLIFGTFIGAAIMLLWVYQRRKLHGAAPRQRWIAATAATAVSLVCPMWFFAIIR